MLDLVIRGGDVVTPQGSQRVDVGVTGEFIAAVAAPGILPTDNARRVIDATGKIVIPAELTRIFIASSNGSSPTARCW